MSWVPAGGWPWQQEVVGVGRSWAWAGGGHRELLLRGQNCLHGLRRRRAGWDWPRGVAGDWPGDWPGEWRCTEQL